MERSKFMLYATLVTALLVVVVIVIAVKGVGSVAPLTLEDQWEYTREYTDKVNDRNYDIMFFRTVPNGPDNLRARTVNTLNPQALNTPGTSYSGHMLILNDVNGGLFLSDSDLASIHDLLVNYGYTVVYLGTNQMQQLVNADIISSLPPEGCASVIVWYDHSGVRSTRNGIADDPQKLMPLVEQQIRPEQVPVFTLIMELGTMDLYWS